MTQVIVIELPDGTDFQATWRKVQSAVGEFPDGSKAYVAISEKAETVLAVFKGVP
jgi:hypothetical protein